MKNKRLSFFSMLLGLLLVTCQLLAPLPTFAEAGDPVTEDATADQPTTNIPETEMPTTVEPPVIENNLQLTAPSALRAGEEVIFTVVFHTESMKAVQGSITYDPALLTYVHSEAIPEDWEMTFSHADGTLKYLGLSTENRNLSGEQQLFQITFRIAEGLAEGSTLPFTLSDATVYNGQEELLLTGGEFTYAVTRPLSTACVLELLTVKGGNLAPAFSANVTEYSITLPYSTETLDITAIPCQYAEVIFSSLELKVGENTVRVTVRSEAGTEQVYTVKVTRLADPNYVPSSDNRILSMELSDGLLFPAFSPEITEYTVYLVKGQDVTLTPTPAGKAIAEALTIAAKRAPGSSADEATAGSFTIVCNAEDGTTRTYTFHTILLDTPEDLIHVQNSIISDNPWTAVLIFSFAAITVFFLGFVASHLFHARNEKTEKKEPTPPTEADSETHTEQ